MILPKLLFAPYEYNKMMEKLKFVLHWNLYLLNFIININLLHLF